MHGAHPDTGRVDPGVGAGAASAADRKRCAFRNTLRGQRHHRDQGAGDRVRVAGVQGSNRQRRRGHRPRVAAARRRDDGQDADRQLRVPHTSSHSQPARSRAHARRQFQRLGGGSGGGDGADRARHADRRIGVAACVVLRRDWFQDHLRSPVAGGRAPVCEEPRYAGVLHAYRGGHARVLGGNGP